MGGGRCCQEMVPSSPLVSRLHGNGYQPSQRPPVSGRAPASPLAVAGRLHHAGPCKEVRGVPRVVVCHKDAGAQVSCDPGRGADALPEAPQGQSG